MIYRQHSQWLLRFLLVVLILSVSVDLRAAGPDKPQPRRGFCTRVVIAVLKRPVRNLVLAVAPFTPLVINEAVQTPISISKADYDDKELGRGAVHIVFVGDSLATGYHRGNIAASTIDLRLRPKRNNWLIGGADVGAGFFERTNDFPLKISNYATPTASIEGPYLFGHDRAFQGVFKVRNLKSQVDDALKQEFNVLLFAMGSNNVDWLAAARESKDFPKGYDMAADPEGLAQAFRQRSAESFAKETETQLDRVIEKAKQAPYPVAIGIYALPRFDKLLSGIERWQQNRRAAGLVDDDTPKFFDSFPSFLPQFKDVSLTFRDELDSHLVRIVEQKNKELEHQNLGSKIRFSLVQTYRNFDPGDPENLGSDRMHPSVRGHNVLAERSVKDLAPSLRFVRP